MQKINSRPVNVLIIENDPSFAATLEIGLAQQGYQTLLASKVDDLPIISAEQPVSLVLLGLGSADYKSFESYDRLRSNQAIGDRPIILVSDDTRGEARNELLKRGANDFLHKPFSLDELFTRIEVHLRLTRLEVIVDENTRNLTNEQTQRKQVEQLYRMAKLINSSLEIDEVLANAARSLKEIFQVEMGALFLADSKKEQIVFLDVQQDSGRTLNRRLLKNKKSIIRRVVDEGRSVILNEIPTDSHHFAEIDKFAKLVTQSILCVPLTTRNNNIGAVALFNKIGCPFTDTDLNLLRSVASSIAIALENAQLHRKQAELVQEIASSHEQLWQSAKLAATGRLAASWAHEINNPLQAVHSCLQLAIHFDLSPEKQAEYIGMACEEVERMIDIVTRILDFARPSPGDLELTNINRVISKVLRLSSKHMAHNHWEVQQNLASDIPEVQAIPDQINQLFLNIVLNAFDAMPNGGKLHITTSHQKDWVLVRLKDTGIGMNSEVLDHIFEPFFTTKTGASGLGLSLSYGIVSRHGGHIEVESNEGQGTAFTVFLPVLHREAIKSTTKEVL
jgi:signal transduction histidine kinase/DNA-binding response OmpR family regulator